MELTKDTTHLTLEGEPSAVYCDFFYKSKHIITGMGWGLLSRFPPFRYFPNFSTSPKYMLAIEYHIHIWQVSLQLSCGDTCQIWMRFKECNRYFCEIENFAYGEIDERSYSNPHPRTVPCTLVERVWYTTGIFVLMIDDFIFVHNTFFSWIYVANVIYI